MLKEYLRTALGCVKRIPMLFARLMPRSKDIYIFGAWLGQKFSDNSRALYLYALEHSRKKCYWITANKGVYKTLKTQGLPVLMAYSLKGLYIQARAGVAFTCVSDGDFCRQMLAGCQHINLWHGVGGGKTIGMDDKEYRENALSFHGRVYGKIEDKLLKKPYFVATGPAMKQVFTTAFGIDEAHFLYAGQPRNDMFYQPDYIPQTISKEEFGGKTVILYMPTHRKTGQVQMDMEKLLDLPALEAFCRENNAVFLIKKHFYHSAEREDLSRYPHILDITNRPVDSNELLMVSDCLISDYSSCTADYLLLDRPIFYYCYDYEDYISQDREMYWDYDSITPGPRCGSFPALLEQLKLWLAQGQDTYLPERKRVRDLFYAPQCQGTACDQILTQLRQKGLG